MASIPMQFQLDDQQPVQAKLFTSDTLAEFTALIQNIYKEKYWMYSFVCHGKVFDLQNTAEFNQMKALLTPGTTLFAITRTKGGGMGSLGSKFVDVTDGNNLNRIELDDEGPEWTTVRPGLSVEGHCTNGRCVAFQELVVINIGLTRFDLNRQKGALSKCPQCQKYVNPITCGFYLCQWRYQGQIQFEETEEPSMVQGQWKMADHAYYRFNSDAKESVNWIELILEARAK